MPEAQAAEAAPLVAADILIRNEAKEVSSARFESWLSRTGLPTSEKIKSENEKLAFVYLEGAAFKTGLLATIPETLSVYGQNAHAGVVTPEIYRSFVEKVGKKLEPGQELVEGEKLPEVLGQISFLKPSRIVILRGSEDPYLSAALVKRLLLDAKIKIEIRTVSQNELDWAKVHTPGLAEEMSALRQEIESLRSAA